MPRSLLDTFFEGDFEVFRDRGLANPNMKALAAREKRKGIQYTCEIGNGAQGR